MKDRRLIKRTVDSIKIGPRHRKDLGNIPSLAASIAKVGLINPITVTSEGLLIAGHRRLEAVKSLGWRTIQCVIADDLESAVSRLTAERDENTERKEMTFSESMSLARALEGLEKSKAKVRQSHGLTAPGKKIDNNQSNASTHVTVSVSPAQPRHTRETDDIVGKALGMSGTTYGRAKAVVKAAENEDLTEEQRNIAKAALAEIELTGNIAGNYKKVRESIRPAPTLTKKSVSTRAREQRYTYNNGLSVISGVVLSLKRVDEFDPEIAFDEIEQWIKNLAESRRNLESIIKRLKKDIENAKVS